MATKTSTSLKNTLATGLDKGFVTAKVSKKSVRPSRRKGVRFLYMLVAFEDVLICAWSERVSKRIISRMMNEKKIMFRFRSLYILRQLFQFYTCVSLISYFIISPLFLLQKLNSKVKAVREIVREVVGLTPLEKRLVDVFKLGIGNPDKRVYKISKHRVRFFFFSMYTTNLASNW